MKEQIYGWRDEKRFLHDLYTASQYYQKNDTYPEVNCQTLPTILNARLNSRTINALLSITFFLKQYYRFTEINKYFKIENVNWSQMQDTSI